jgi:hypothetical protein
LKHAGSASINTLNDLLDQIRGEKVLKEKKPGVFYLKSTAFLHFHEDVSGLFADLRVNDAWQRFPVTALSEQELFIEKFRELMKPLDS